MTDDRPWLRFYGSVPATLDYPEVTLYEALAATARRVPRSVAWDFLGTQATYAQFLAEVDRCAAALAAEGLRRGDRFLISMPTSPQGVIAFYAANRLGALPALIHPLSTAPEITHFLDATGARMALTLDAFYGPLAAAAPKQPLEQIVIARIPDYLSPLKRLGFWVTKGRKIPPVPGRPARAPVVRAARRRARRRRSRPAAGPTTRRRSSSPAARPGCRRASCCPTATSSPRACRRPRGAAWARRTRSSRSCRSSTASGSACA